MRGREDDQYSQKSEVNIERRMEDRRNVSEGIAELRVLGR